MSVLSLCEKGDAYIMAETGKVFKKEKEMKKGESKMTLVRVAIQVNCGGPLEKSVDAVVFVCRTRRVEIFKQHIRGSGRIV